MRAAKRETEAGISKAIRDYLDIRGVMWVRTQSGKLVGSYAKKDGKMSRWVVQLNPPGTADLLCFPVKHMFDPGGWKVPIRVDLWLEIKRPDGKQSDDQVAFQKRVTSLRPPQYYAVVRSIDDVEKVLAKL